MLQFCSRVLLFKLHRLLPKILPFKMAAQPGISGPSTSHSHHMIEEEHRSSLGNNGQLSRCESKKSSPSRGRDAEPVLQSSMMRMPEKFDEMSYAQIALVLFR